MKIKFTVSFVFLLFFCFPLLSFAGPGSSPSPSPSPISTPSPALVAQYEFLGDFTDVSGNGHTGTGSGDFQFGTGVSNKNLAFFNGVDTYVTVSASSALNMGYTTVAFWVKPVYDNYVGKTYAILSKGMKGNKEFAIEIIGQSKGFSVVPGTVDASTISGPTGLVVQDGGIDAALNKRVMYISWKDNSGKTLPYHVDVSDAGAAAITNDLPAGTDSFRICADVNSAPKKISVCTYAPGNVYSKRAEVQVSFVADGIKVLPLTEAPSALLPMDSKWHHVARTIIPGGETKYYIDGQLVATVQTKLGPRGGGPVLIGAIDPSEHLFKGSLAKLEIYNYMLSANSISALYLSERNDFRNVDLSILGGDSCATLTEPSLSQCSAELESLSETYQPSWSLRVPAVINDPREMEAYLMAKWKQQRQFYIDLITKLEKYHLLPKGQSAASILAVYQPIWQVQLNNKAWINGSDVPEQSLRAASSVKKISAAAASVPAEVRAAASASADGGGGACSDGPGPITTTNYVSPVDPLVNYSKYFDTPKPQVNAQVGRVQTTTTNDGSSAFYYSDFSNYKLSIRHKENFVKFNGSQLYFVQSEAVGEWVKTSRGISANSGFGTNYHFSSGDYNAVANEVPGDAPVSISNYSGLYKTTDHLVCGSADWTGYTGELPVTIGSTSKYVPLTKANISQNGARVTVNAFMENYSSDSAWQKSIANGIGYAALPLCGGNPTGISGLTWGIVPGDAVTYQQSSLDPEKLDKLKQTFSKKISVAFTLTW
ncbi:MAG: hypothetical protein HQL22_01180 [Candidatus Omnitrophica bacterium]|nr:hypothetical protein [Candidatus Omnitrophota bacterium]